jgi:hypothetical protein
MPFPTKEQIIATLRSRLTEEQQKEAERLASTLDPMLMKLVFRLLPTCLNCKNQLDRRATPDDPKTKLCKKCGYTYRAGTMRKHHPELNEPEEDTEPFIQTEDIDE